ncbi:flagellar basal body rod protein FlgB [Zhaonella formicivorans]|uniref:flagellar basal body rod protein FlgB n=1 Tax=Zhaonella formicivorans TaxID=2528593 RepID=UPI0010D98975|nr:flagellar basal body rod protein FlgB [Zhaonella formicivorans]
MRVFSNNTMQILAKALDTASLRQSVLAHNIANVNTPGYKRSYVVFEESLQKALGKNKGIILAGDKPGHIRPPQTAAEVRPVVETDRNTSLRQDGNNVDIDAEMVQVAMNSINYNAAASQLNSRLGILRYVINDGRR